MCGIFGMISNKGPVAGYVARALVALKNRGKNSTGLVDYSTSDKRFGQVFRAEGNPSFVFASQEWEKDLESRVGNVCIGHNRYATAGSNLTRDATPLVMPRPGIALAHNGQVSNIVSLSAKLEDIGFNFLTECDAEVIMDALAQNLVNNRFYKATTSEQFFHEKVVPSLKDLMDKSRGAYFVDGAYAEVVILSRRGLLAFRDPHGIRPLSFATRKNGETVDFAFSSETSAFNYLNTVYDFDDRFEGFTDLERGEAIFVDSDLNVFRQVIHQKQEAFCSFEPVYFAYDGSVIHGRGVHESRYNLGIAIAQEFAELKDSVDVIMDLPQTPQETAKAISREWEKPYNQGILKLEDTRGFQEPTQDAREKAADNKYFYNEEYIRGQRVLLVDDSIVRSTTLQKVIKRLRSLGAKEVHVVICYPPIKKPCVCGIDTPTERELAASNMTPVEIKEVIGANSLHYLGIERMLSAVNLTRDNSCTACITGEYPIDITEYQAYLVRRVKERVTMTRKAPKCT